MAGSWEHWSARLGGAWDQPVFSQRVDLFLAGPLEHEISYFLPAAFVTQFTFSDLLCPIVGLICD